MCGRFTLRTNASELVRLLFPLRVADRNQLTLGLAPRLNVCPTQPILIVRRADDPQDNAAPHELVWSLPRWGLVPHWAADASRGASMINARSETVADKPSFRESFRKRRCLIPADGFYEWAVVPGQRTKRPCLIDRVDGSPLWFAGLWDRWLAPDGVLLETCSILTTSANSLLATIHDRMPVLLDAPAREAWLSARTSPTDLLSCLIPATAESLQLRDADPTHVARGIA
jgi:putative SOS response-associated peptidase YedK